MKKILLSGFVVVSFVVYSLLQRPDPQPQSNADPGLTLVVSPTPAPSVPTQTVLPPTQIPRRPVVPPTPTPTISGIYRNGQYTGTVADAFYGNVQVRTTISSGQISNVQFLQYPNDRSHSIEINSYATPILAQEAIRTQSANVDIVSGATATSQAFVESLQSTLDQAKI